MANATDDNIHVGDVGTIFEVTVVEGDTVVDISNPTVLTIKLRKPSGAVVSHTATLSSDGTDGKLRYISIAGDIDQDGPWALQAYVELLSWQGSTAIGEFDVLENL